MTVDSVRQLRVLRRLEQDGTILASLDDAGRQYGVFTEGDRRRRPLARLNKVDLDQLLSDGALNRIAGGFALTEAGRARVRRSGQSHDGFGAQHRDIQMRSMDDGEGETDQCPVNGAESPLIWLARRGGPDGEPFLTKREFVAGETLRNDYERSLLPSRVTMDWSATGRVDGGRWRPDAPVSDVRVSATDRVLNAMRHVGPGLDRVLQAVCCQARGLDNVERGFGWPRRSAKIVLKIGLSRLADHYRLSPDS